MTKSELKTIIFECIEEIGLPSQIKPRTNKSLTKKSRGKFPNWMDPKDKSGINKPTRSRFDVFKARQKYNSKPTVVGTNFKGSMGIKKSSSIGKLTNLKRKISGGRI